MSLDAARAVADAVLMEGYALYPYRASAPKNRYRWTFGVLAPRAWSEAGGCEPWWLEAQVLVTGEAPSISARARFFQIERRVLDGGGRWDGGVLRTVELTGTGEVTFRFDAERDDTRERRALCGRASLRCEPVACDRPLHRVTIRIENITPWTEPGAPRDHAIASAFASTHLLIAAGGGALLSAIDPPPWARAAAEACSNTGTYPVLVGPDGEAMLAAPFILYDNPSIAPESVGDLCDATEIDELLLLRTRTLTDAEKREARGTDPYTARIVERAEALSDERMARLHGAARDLRGGEMVPQRRPPVVGEKVRLRRSDRRTDAQDLLYAGCIATVAEIRHDVDGTVFYAVTIDDDPGAELEAWYGRFRYYRIDELEPP